MIKSMKGDLPHYFPGCLCSIAVIPFAAYGGIVLYNILLVLLPQQVFAQII